MAGLVATSMVVLSLNAAAAALSFKRRQVIYPNVFEGEGLSMGETDEVSVAWGLVTRTVSISSSSYHLWLSLRSLSFEVLRCTAI